LTPRPPVDWKRDSGGSAARFAREIEELKKPIVNLSIDKRRYSTSESAQERVVKWAQEQLPWLDLEKRDRMAAEATQKLGDLWEKYMSFYI